VDSWIDREHHLRARAEQILVLLQDLWGDSPPPSPDPQLAILIDAVAGDDEYGRAAHVVVHGDGLTYQHLIQALMDPGPRSVALAKLPPPLVRRLAASGVGANVSPGMAALPDERCGAWELNGATGIVSFDATCARLMGAGHRAGRRSFASAGQDTTSGSAGQATPAFGDQDSPSSTPSAPVGGVQEVSTVHPDDRPLVAAAMREALDTGRGYQMRFRVRMPDGVYVWRASRARVLPATDFDATRLMGFVADDQWPFPLL
jgi:hypothetical protein